MLEPVSLLRPIYVVDDNADDLRLLRELLRRGGVENPVVTIQFGADGLSRLRRLANDVDAAHPMFPGALVVDGNMPVLDGFGLIAATRAMPAYNGLRIVMLSGSDRPEDRRRALQAGANDYAVKFPPAEDLVRLVTRFDLVRK